MSEEFRVGLTRDFLTPDGRVGWGDIGLAALDAAPGVEWGFLDADQAELSAAAVAGYDALIVLLPRVTAATVAIAALTLVLAALHRVREKDALVRTGRWHAKLDHMGHGAAGRTLGIVGWGNVGRELSRLAAPLGMRQVASDPYADPAAAAAAGVALVDIDTLVAEADVVVVTCALTPQTHHLLDAGRIATMKPTAYLVNVARGPIVDQPALTRALADRRIAGAALDVFDPEPPDPDDPLLALDNVLLAPHAIAWTDELALGNGGSAIRAVLDVAAGRTPSHVVNPEVLR